MSIDKFLLESSQSRPRAKTVATVGRSFSFCTTFMPLHKFSLQNPLPPLIQILQSKLPYFHHFHKPTKRYSTRVLYNSNVKLNALSRAGKIEAARHLFDTMPFKDVVSWNSIITAYWQNGHLNESKKLFESMPQRNIVSWNCMIAGCIDNDNIYEAFDYFQMMPEKNVSSWNAMISGFVRYNRIDDAVKLFKEMRKKNVISYTVMIDGYVKSGKIELARGIFDRIKYKNDVTWTVMINGYVENEIFDEARELFEKMPDQNIAVMTSMIIGYSKEGKMENARELFEKIQNRDRICWNAIITGYAQNEIGEEALKLHKEMLKTGVQPDHSTLVSVLFACSCLASLKEGRQLHALLVKIGSESNLSSSNALIAMYNKCGCVTESELAFTQISCPDFVSWNTVIAAFAQHGLIEQAFHTFYLMEINSCKPDEVTFLSLLSVCGHVGKVQKSMDLFESMVKNHNITPRSEHYVCLVDSLSRAGELEKAFKIIQEMAFEADSKIWSALLAACAVYTNPELAELVANNILTLDRYNAGAYVLLSNIYAAAGLWREVTRVRVLMKERGVKKQRACSWTEIGDEVHSFLGGDISHPDIDRIHLELKGIRLQMKDMDDFVVIG